MADRAPEPVNPGVELVLDHLKRTRSFDFTGYKRGTLTRRIDKRMEQVGIADHASYVDHLEVHPEEFQHLFNTILINVTSFFRDAEAWAAIRQQILPDLLSRSSDGPIRLWSAGCATGQEAYSLVMLLAEELGIDAVIERVKVYATDIDDDALEQARRAVFSDRDVEALPPELLERYFETTSGGHAFHPDLRRTVIFGRHDLLQDAPISRIDLLLCRNTLMYFNSDVQAQLVDRLHFALDDDGYLMLGKVEMLLGRTDSFVPIDMRQRIFRKVIRTSMRSRLLAMSSGAGSGIARSGTEGDPVLDVAFEHRPHAEVLLDPEGLLVAANERARTAFAIPVEALGSPFQDLELSYRPVELRSWVEQARLEGRTVTLTQVECWSRSGEVSYLDIHVVPLLEEHRVLGTLVAFADVTPHRQLQEELEATHRELETAYEELQSSNEELETTNEELQSTVEELETTNEELQSTNEELETMNEELSSTNEELQTINDELRDRTGELNQVNAYMESILTSLHASVIVLDSDLSVRVWNGQSFDMWGLRPEEVEGRGFLSLDIGFPVEVLGGALRASLAGDGPDEPIYVEARTRRGERIRCRTRVSPMSAFSGGTDGVIVLIEDDGPAPSA